MNQHRFTSLLFCAAMVLFLASCGGSGEKSSDTTDSTTTTDTSTASVPKMETNTIVTTAQNMMVATHKVADFDKWKTSYDEHDSLRLANGVHSYVVGRGLDDPSMVLVAVKVDDLNKAKAFAKDPSLKKAMQKGGVVGMPDIKFTTMVWQDTATIDSKMRSRTTFSVKDWEAWKNAFDSGKQQRMDAGIIDRAYGHDADDTHKVTVVVALTDTARAKAYWKSDALKQRMATSGVIGQPKRFLYTVVQRY